MPSGRIALLEDDPLLRALVEESLVSEGYQVQTADSYGQLLEMLSSPGIQAVVADFWGHSHGDLSPADQDEVRALGQLVPTVLVSGRSWLGQVDTAALGVIAILPKPYDLDALLDAIERAVAASSSS